MKLEQLVLTLMTVGIVGAVWFLYAKLTGTRDQRSTSPEPGNVETGTSPTIRDPITSAPSISTSERAAAEPIVYAFVDLETTGLDCVNDRIIEICVFNMVVGNASHDGKRSLINPERSLTPFISELTGITDEMLKDAPGEDHLKEFFDFIGRNTVVAYNAQFDMGFLRAAAKRLGLSFDNSSLCVMERLRKECPNLRSYKLGNACEAFGIEVDGDAHRAEHDVKKALFLWNAINRGEKPNQSFLRADPYAPEYGVYGHYRNDGLLFYVWTARNGESTIPDRDSTWSIYVEKHLDGEYEIRCLTAGVGLQQAIEIKDQLLADHADTLVNRVNPYRDVIRENFAHYERLKASWNDDKNKGKELERTDPSAAVEHYKNALVWLNEAADLLLEKGLFGQVVHDLNRQAHGGEALRILDRISLLLCKAKHHDEADKIANGVFEKYPSVVDLKAAGTITKRIGKGLAAEI